MKLPSVYIPRILPDLKLNGTTNKQSGLPEYLNMTDFLIYVNGIPFIIPAGYITDLASIPWGFRNTFNPANPQSAAAALGHDFPYGAELIRRSDADKLFFAILNYVQVDGPRELPMFLAVHLFGWTTYRKHTTESIMAVRAHLRITETRRPLFKKLNELQKLWEISPYYRARRIINYRIYA